MTGKCPDCHNNLAEGARFCSRCGRPVAPASVPLIPKCPTQSKRCRFGFALPVLMVLVVGAAIWRGGGSSCPVEDRTLSKTFRLDGHKLGRLYDLLRPKDVPVAVAMRRGHLIVEGTEREVRDIERFMALVGAAGDARNPDPRWVDAEYLSHSYHLSKEHAARLDQVLSFADVHGFSICTGSILTVEASEDFHDALMPVVRILGGTRLD